MFAGGVSGETEELLSVLLNFDVESGRQSDVRIYTFIMFELLCRIHFIVTGVKLIGMWQQCVGGRLLGVRSVQKGMRQRNVYHWGK